MTKLCKVIDQFQIVLSRANRLRPIIFIIGERSHLHFRLIWIPYVIEKKKIGRQLRKPVNWIATQCLKLVWNQFNLGKIMVLVWEQPHWEIVTIKMELTISSTLMIKRQKNIYLIILICWLIILPMSFQIYKEMYNEIDNWVYN